MFQTTLKNHIYIFVTLVTLALSQAGCKLTEDEQNLLDDAFGGSVAPEVPDLPNTEDSCFVDRHTQPEAELTKKIDILFVSDTSGSLNAEREEIALGIDSFVAELPDEVDYQVGVMLAHGSTSSYSGKLYQRGSEPVVLSNQELTLNEIRNHLRKKMLYIKTDGATDGGEVGLYSFTRGITSQLEANRESGFFRNDAALAVVFVADENDICADYPEGVTPVPDPNGKEGPAKERDCAGINPASVLQQIKQLQGDRPYLISGITYNDLNNVPSGGENEFGYGYDEIIMKANGLSIDLATGNFSVGLASIGSLATKKLNLITDFPLSRAYVDTETIEVRVDGQMTSHNYQEDTKLVHVSEPGQAQSTVDISYCLLEEPETEPDPGEPGDQPGDEPDDVPPPGCIYPVKSYCDRDKDNDGFDDTTGEPLL